MEPRFIVYLKTNPENLLKRINERGRIEESNISLQYLQKLHRLHENYIKSMEKKCKIMTIDANTKLSEPKLDQILCFVKEMGGVDSK